VIDRLQEMLDAMIDVRSEVRPSEFWTELNKKNVEQLESEGYGNFKRTIARNYFTWIAGFRHPLLYAQTMFLLKNVRITKIPSIVTRAFFSQKQHNLPIRSAQQYDLLTRLLWEYARQNDKACWLDKLAEPEEGNPLPVFVGPKLISQDLANSFLEFKAIVTGGLDAESVKTVVELGAGYGRTAFVFLKLMPNIRYMIADIPPALYVAERYLSNQFQNKRIFKFRPFSDYTQIQEELDNSEIAFFLPHQLELLPPKTADLFINISSLHEMTLDQIHYYFTLIDRLTGKYFYMKQWKVSHNPQDNVVIRETDYPIPDHWKQFYWRECQVQTFFFEALFGL
jgi:putative sugar O-methyltransferase